MFMATRSTAQAEAEKAIFAAFVAAHPSFRAQIKVKFPRGDGG
jgi:hypothetical protein